MPPKPQRKFVCKRQPTTVHKPPFDRRADGRPDARSRFHDFEGEELRAMLARLDPKASIVELGLWFEIMRDLKFRDPTYEQELPDGVRPAVD
jgi:hypothetical protein